MFQKSKLKELSFLVYGLGLSGCSVVKFLIKNKITNFKVWDDKQKTLFKKYRTKGLSKTLREVDYIVLSPGVSLFKNKKLNNLKKKIITDIDLFYLSNSKFTSIVVTGTNGKSTTCNLIKHLLKKNKFNTFLGGNIGNPILNFKNKKKSFVIIEASSFQLSHSQFICPDFAFFLNLSNDHLDWHGNKINYLNSKLKIFQLQTKKQYAIGDKIIKKKFLEKNFSSKFVTPKLRVYLKIKNKIENEYLRSDLNDENMSFVYTLSKLLKINQNSFINAMKTFKGLPHRFEFFLKKNNFTFINDSKATSFSATSSAISSLKNIFWILGGLPKKDDKINVLKYKKNIIKCYLIGNHINFFKKQIKGKLLFSVTKNLKNTIIKIREDKNLAKKNTNFILLSPAAASFDQFLNFEKRGLEFKKICKKYVKKFN